MKEPQLTDAVLIVVADQRQARLAACKRLRNGRVHVEHLSKVAEAWDEKAHDNPPSRSDSAGHQYDTSGHLDGERIHRFAKELMRWLGRERPKHAWERLAVFAEPRILGALRSEVPAHLRKDWIEHAVDLMSFSDGELAARPEVAALLPAVPE